MKTTIFYLEGRGGQFLYHFLILNLGGLYHILNKQYNIRSNDSELITSAYKNKIVDKPSNDLCFPIKIHMTNILPFHREAFEMIKNKFELIEDLSTLDYDYEIVSIYGATLIGNDKVDNNIYTFLRNLFLENVETGNNNEKEKKQIFITRQNSLTHGRLKRSVINEHELLVMLKKYNFEIIQLEDLSVHEKIKLFLDLKLFCRLMVVN